LWEHLRTNLPYRIVSLLLAISAWAWVTTIQNPVREALYEIPLESRDLSADLMVENKPATVNIRVQARDSILNNFTSRDYLAYVSLKDAEIGSNVVPVQASLPFGVEIVNINPSIVSIKIDQTTQIQMPVRPAISGEIPSNYMALEPTVSPTEVLISGPKSILDKVADVVADITLREQRESYLERVPLKIFDADGNSLQDWVKIQPSTVEIFVPVLRNLPSKIFVLKPILVGLEPGKSIKQVVVQPELAELYGRWELLEDLDYLYTRPIDLAEAEDVLVTEVELELPEGSSLGISPLIKVTIELE